MTEAVAVAAARSIEAVPAPARKSTYGQILASSAIVGGSTLVTVLIAIVRTKLMALMLGPAGMGLVGAYTAVADLARSVAEMGISRSGVRQIAEASGSGDARRLARTVIVVRRVCVLLGLTGAIMLLAVATPVAKLTFGDDQHANGIRLLSLVVFLGLVSGGQGAVLQGMRQIASLARMGIWGAVFGAVASVVLVYWLGMDGIVASLVAIAAATCLLSWWYARKVGLAESNPTFGEMRSEAASLLRLGLAFLASGLLMMGATYVVRIIVLRTEGLAGAGLYQAGLALGGLYVGFVLQAMGTDFYPRLVASANDDAECNRLVNEQAHVSILLAGPGVIATLVLSPWLVTAFYSAGFAHAADTLRWICVGMAMRVITWPMGFIIVARNRQMIFVLAEVAWTVVNLGLSWIFVTRFGQVGAGMAFFGSYVFHALLVYPIVRGMTGFSGSRASLRATAIFIGLAGAAFLLMYLPPVAALSLGLPLLGASTLHSVTGLLALVETDRLPRLLRRLLSWRRQWS